MLNIVALIREACDALNVYAEIPTPVPDPVMRLEENGVFTQSSHMPDTLAEYEVEAQTWGSTKSAAYGLVVDVYEVLRGQPANQHGSVSKFQLVSNIYERDPETLVDGQPGPRYISILRVWARPSL